MPALFLMAQKCVTMRKTEHTIRQSQLINYINIYCTIIYPPDFMLSLNSVGDMPLNLLNTRMNA